MNVKYTLFTLGLALVACDKPGSTGGPVTASTEGVAPATSASGGLAVTNTTGGKPVTLVIAYGSEKKTWLEERKAAFLATKPKTPSGAPILVETKAMGSGEAMNAVLDGSLKADVFSPASGLYVSLVNDAWLAKGNKAPLTKGGDALVLSPIVIGMWKPMAEALGWPKKRLSWRDVLSVATDPKGWGTRGAPEWGKLKFAHTHPEFSNSGYQALVAEAYAGAKKTRGLTLADVDAAATTSFIGNVENTIVHYGKSTGFFSDKMVERGPSYLSAAILYENLVVESYAKNPAMPIVAIYPTEGTFWSDHPYAVLDAPWSTPDKRAAAVAFEAFLKNRESQERALALGFRPADAKLAVGAPVDAAHGVDPKQPETILELPDAAVLQKLLKVWNDVKKGADLQFVFDKSGSMNGNPLTQAKLGAKTFLGALADRDEVTLVFFDNQIYPPFGPKKVATSRTELLQRIDLTFASGGTALYDATAVAYDAALARTKTAPNQIHALMVMTDGKDESSKMNLDQLLAKFPKDEATVRIFTIAYGGAAESKPLMAIADAAKGSFAKGNVDTIKDVYAEMASFF